MRAAVGAGDWACAMNSTRLLGILVCAALIACAVSGCGRSKGRVLGKEPKGDIRPIVAVTSGDTPSQVVLKGEIIEKCPTAGCWFDLHDSTGTLRVDTKTAGFVVLTVPLHSQVTVSGRVVWDGDVPTIEATGLRY